MTTVGMHETECQSRATRRTRVWNGENVNENKALRRILRCKKLLNPLTILLSIWRRNQSHEPLNHTQR